MYYWFGQVFRVLSKGGGSGSLEYLGKYCEAGSIEYLGRYRESVPLECSGKHCESVPLECSGKDCEFVLLGRSGKYCEIDIAKLRVDIKKYPLPILRHTCMPKDSEEKIDMERDESFKQYSFVV